MDCDKEQDKIIQMNISNGTPPSVNKDVATVITPVTDEEINGGYDSEFSISKESGDLLREELKALDKDKENANDMKALEEYKKTSDKKSKEVEQVKEKKRHANCLVSHDMRECDPEYDGHHSMEYYNDLWGGLSCIMPGCPHAGLSFGQMIKKKIKVFYCKLCENYGEWERCNHVICNVCKVRQEDQEMGNRRRSKRTRRG